MDQVSGWQRDVGASAQTYEVGAHFEALVEGILMAPLDSSYTQVGFNLTYVQVCFIVLRCQGMDGNKNAGKTCYENALIAS